MPHFILGAKVFAIRDRGLTEVPWNSENGPQMQAPSGNRNVLRCKWARDSLFGEHPYSQGQNLRHPSFANVRCGWRWNAVMITKTKLRPRIKKFLPDLSKFKHTHGRVEARVGQPRVRNVSLAYQGQMSAGEKDGMIPQGLVAEVTSLNQSWPTIRS